MTHSLCSFPPPPTNVGMRRPAGGRVGWGVMQHAAVKNLRSHERARLAVRHPHPTPAKLAPLAKPTQPSPARREGCCFCWATGDAKLRRLAHAGRAAAALGAGGWGCGDSRCVALGEPGLHRLQLVGEMVLENPRQALAV